MAYRAEIEIAVKGANQLSSFQGKLNASALAVDNLNKFLETFTNKGEGISRSILNLNRQLQTAARNFNEVALGTDEAKTAAINYLNATRNLNEGLRERAALLAEVAENERKAKLAAAGIRETTQFSGPIGPGRATTFGTGQEFVGQSSPVAGRVQRALEGRKDELELQRALQALDQRGVSTLEEKLNIQTKITNLVSLQAQRAKDAQLQGQSLRIPTPFRTAGSMGFPVALPEIEQDRKLRERAQAQESARRALNLQRSNSLLTQGVTNLKLQVAVAQQLGGVYEEIVRSLKTVNERQSKLFRARSNRQQRQELGQENVERVKRINQLAGNRVLQENLKNKAYQVGAKLRNNEFNQAKQLGVEIDNLIKAEDARIDRARRVLKFRQKERAEIRATAKERGRRRRDAASNAIIGGAFPLLFGQGGGAAVGGALGGGAGGLVGGQFGFGLSLVGTQLGTIVDTFVQNTQKLAESLKSPVETLGALEEAGFLVDDSVKQAVQQLLKANKVYEAQAIALKEVTDTLGPDAVKLLTAYDAENKKLKSEYERLTASITSGVLPSLVGAIALINDFSSALNSVKIPEGLTRFLFQLGISGAAGVIPGLGTAKAAAEFVSARGRRAGEEAGPPGLSPELVEQAEKAAAEEVKRQSTLERSEEILRAQIEAQRAGVDLLDENLVAAKENVIQQRYYRDLVEEQNKGLDTQLPKLNRALALAQLRAQVTAAEKANQARLDREAEQAARKRALEEKRAEQERVRNKVQGLNLDLQLIKVNQDQVTLQTGEIAGITRKLLDLAETKKILTDIATLNSKNPENLNKELDLIDQKLDYEQRILEAKRNQAKVDLEAFVDAALTANKRAVEDAERQTQAVRTQLQNTFDIQAQQSNALLTEQLEKQISLTRRLQDEERKLNDQKAKASSIEDKELAGVLLDDFKKTAEALTNELHLRQELERQQLRQNQLTEKYGFLANELSTAMSSAVQAVVTGTGTVEEAFSTMFANIGKAFIDMATQMLAQKLFMTVLSALGGGGGGFSFSGGSASSGLSAANLMGGAGPLNAGMFGFGRANGGPVSPGSTHLVGERGPELLTMGPSGGYVTSNSASQAAMDRYSSGNARGGSISVNYNVTDINGMRFVTEDQFRAGVAQAAKQGADGGFNRTMSSLKNNRSTRSRIGV